jgi:hypothetical protein
MSIRGRVYVGLGSLSACLVSIGAAFGPDVPFVIGIAGFLVFLPLALREIRRYERRAIGDENGNKKPGK